MSASCSHTTEPLDADGLLTLAVLMAVDDAPLSLSAIAARVANLAAPGFDVDRARVAAAVARLHADGCLKAVGDTAGEVAYGDVTGEVASGDVTGEVASGDVTGEVAYGDAADEVAWRIAEAGRELATELGGRAPGQACDATRTCLLLRLCLDATMPAQNRRVLVTSLLQLDRDAAAETNVSGNR